MQWWERIRALAGLAVVVVVLGIGLALFVGTIFFLGGFLLEQVVAG